MLIFSITTELVRNVQKRAGATEATVQLLYHPDQLNLTVEDNGPPAPTHDGADTGWRNLRIKAEYLKADLLIDANDQGNSVMLSVPIPLS
jgi:signal transduction histidine kinase